jgi:antitoxin (DNA-binding transcriptional repressor) of toxin-antitoxin stability system
MYTSHVVKTVNASEFKAKCLAILDEINRSGETLIITKRGRAVARLSPAAQGSARYPQSELIGTVEVVADIIEPPFSPESWEVEQDR